jgi:hypothetical protein
MATQLMGGLQVSGSIIGLFLDLTREAFRHGPTGGEPFCYRSSVGHPQFEREILLI